MTRRSKREIERAVDDLGANDAGTVHEWIGEVLAEGFTLEFGAAPSAEFTVVDDDGEVSRAPDHDGQVCIQRQSGDVGTEFWIDEADVPEWIDAEADLPVIE